MDSQFKKIDSLLSEKRFKLHIFEPSNRKIWTVVGVDKEYWFEPDLEFCSCPGYYFNNECYHLDWFPKASIENKVELNTLMRNLYNEALTVEV